MLKKFLKFCLLVVLFMMLAFVALVSYSKITGESSKDGANKHDKPAAAVPVHKICPEELPAVHYFALDAKKGSNRFGPDQAITAKHLAWQRFGQKLFADPLFAATVLAYTDHDLAGIDLNAVQTKAQEYVANRKLWCTDLDTWYTKLAPDFGLAPEETAAYNTLGMKPQGADKMPKLIRSHQNHSAGLSLVLTLKNGELKWFRIACDFQPFEAAPPRQCEPGQCDKTTSCKTNCSGTPPCKVNCTPPPCVKDCKPKCVKPPQPGENYKWDDKSCKWVPCACVDKTKVQQPVQDNGLVQASGVNTGKTPGAPAAAPTNNTTKTNNPTAGGTNSGSSTGSGTPSGGHTGGGKTTSSSSGSSQTNEQGGSNGAPISNPFGG